MQLRNLSVDTPLGEKLAGRECLVVDGDSEPDGFGPGSVVAEEVESLKEFYISFTLKKRFARLHRMGGCHRTPGKDVHNFLFMDTIHEASWDDFCRQCWRLGAFPGNERGKGSVDGSASSSSEGSSSTEAEGEMSVEQ